MHLRRLLWLLRACGRLYLRHRLGLRARVMNDYEAIAEAFRRTRCVRSGDDWDFPLPAEVERMAEAVDRRRRQW